MKEHPILFSTPMIKAILEGRKTVTRRIITPQNSDCTAYRYESKSRMEGFGKLDFNDVVRDGIGAPDGYLKVFRPEDGTRHRVHCKWSAEDQLWVRESFSKVWVTTSNKFPEGHSEYRYKADHKGMTIKGHDRYKPSIHMPHEASRIQLLITSVRPERLHDITEEDARMEGVEKHWYDDHRETPGRDLFFVTGVTKDGFGFPSAVEAFQDLWVKINGAESWLGNPWVWRTEFNRIK